MIVLPRSIVTLVVLAAAMFVARGANALDLPKESRVPGGIALLAFEGAAEPLPRVMFGGRRAPVFRDGEAWIALVGCSALLGSLSRDVRR